MSNGPDNRPLAALPGRSAYFTRSFIGWRAA